MLNMGRKTVQFTLFPERLAKNKEQYKESGQAAKSYEKVRGKKWVAIMRRHRHYKQKALSQKYVK